MKTKKNKNKNKNKTKKNKKNYRGGALDNSFLSCYGANLAKIQAAIEKFSGKHAIDNDIANEFINGQLTDVRKQAARDLVENTIYITLQEVADITEQLILNMYEENSLNSAEIIYLYVGPINKSFYFISVLALYYIKKHQLKEPTFFITAFDNDFFNTVGKNPIIMLDDVSYSGAQLSRMLHAIYFERVVKAQKISVEPPYPPNLIVGLIALNDFSKEKLEKVPITGRTQRDKSILFTDFIKTPFKITFLPERLYTPLIKKIGLERYFNIHVFFSPYTDNTPFVSIYLDNKIADEASTFKKALTYGPIVPSNYDYTNLFLTIDSEMESMIFTDEVIKIYNTINGTTFKYGFDLEKHLIEKIKTAETEIPNITQISFKPFIKGCNTNQALLENIQDVDIINCPYYIFTAPEGCIKNNNDCVVLPHVKDYLHQELEKDIEMPIAKAIAKAIEITNKIDSFTCPVSWYKKGEFQMTCLTHELV